VTGLSTLYNGVDLNYDIVCEKYSGSRILVFLEGVFDDVDVSFKRNTVFVNVREDSRIIKAVNIKLKRRIKCVAYKIKNGVLTIDVKYKLFPP